jgi:tyrosyl-tRNA synthetase
VTLQIGGSDQWGNITAGIELIRRAAGGESHALTFPLITNSSGTKFGKSEGANVWLDPERTSPYRFYQYWINIDDRDASRYLRLFTLLPREEIEALDAQLAADPAARVAQRRLAEDVTGRVHGADAVKTAAQVSAFIFGDLDPAQLSTTALELLREEAPFREVTESEVLEATETGAGTRYDVLKMLTVSGLAPSNGAAKRLLEQGGISVNRRKLTASERYIDPATALLAGRHVIVGKGKRDYALLRITA